MPGSNKRWRCPEVSDTAAFPRNTVRNAAAELKIHGDGLMVDETDHKGVLVAAVKGEKHIFWSGELGATKPWILRPPA